MLAFCQLDKTKMIENELEISREIRVSMENALEIIYSFLSQDPSSTFFGDRTTVKKNVDRQTLGEIYESKDKKV